MAKTTELPKLLTPAQLAEVLSVSEASLAQDRYMRQGMPYIKVGKRVRYELDAVIAYLENQRVKPSERV